MQDLAQVCTSTLRRASDRTPSTDEASPSPPLAQAGSSPARNTPAADLAKPGSAAILRRRSLIRLIKGPYAHELLSTLRPPRRRGRRRRARRLLRLERRRYGHPDR